MIDIYEQVANMYNKKYPGVNLTRERAKELVLKWSYSTRGTYCHNGVRLPLNSNATTVAKATDLAGLDTVIKEYYMNFIGGNIKLKGKKIYYNENVTILTIKDQNKKFISKNTDDHYDLEKGIMMSLLKSEGYTYQDVKQLMDRAKPVSEMSKKA